MYSFLHHNDMSRIVSENEPIKIKVKPMLIYPLLFSNEAVNTLKETQMNYDSTYDYQLNLINSHQVMNDFHFLLKIIHEVETYCLIHLCIIVIQWLWYFFVDNNGISWEYFEAFMLQISVHHFISNKAFSFIDSFIGKVENRAKYFLMYVSFAVLLYYYFREFSQIYN